MGLSQHYTVTLTAEFLCSTSSLPLALLSVLQSRASQGQLLESNPSIFSRDGGGIMVANTDFLSFFLFSYFISTGLPKCFSG